MATIDERLAGEVVSPRAVIAAAAVGILVVAELADPGRPVQLALALTATGVVVAWTRWPILPVPVLVAGVVVPLVALGATGLRLEPTLLLLVAVALVVGATAPVGPVAVAEGAALLGAPVVIAVLPPARLGDGWTWVVAVGLGLVTGALHRRHADLATELDRARRALADQAAADERRRIARDVHDLVGHALSVVLLHITSARHGLQRDLDAADEALRAAEDLGRRSLDDVRRTVRALASPADERDGARHAGAPVRSAAGIAALVDQARSAGLDVDLIYHGDLGRLDGATGVALHRIAEESLANVGRHAADARTTVRMRVAGDRAVLEVTSVGIPARHRPGKPGAGIAAMTERATTLGGALTAGPIPGGWRVRCTVPVAARSIDLRSGPADGRTAGDGVAYSRARRGAGEPHAAAAGTDPLAHRRGPGRAPGGSDAPRP